MLTKSWNLRKVDSSQKGKTDNSFPKVQEHLSKSIDIRPPLSNTINRDERKNNINLRIWFINLYLFLPLKGWWLLKLHLFCGIFRASRGEEVSGWSGVKRERQEQEGSTLPNLLLIHISFAQLFYPSSSIWGAKLKGTPIPHICHFWYATKFFRPVKGTPKKCVNSRQKLHRDKTA